MVIKEVLLTMCACLMILSIRYHFEMVFKDTATCMEQNMKILWSLSVGNTTLPVLFATCLL